MKLTPKTGEIVGAAMVQADQTVIMMTTGGQMIRIPVAQISRIGRATQGVTLRRMEAAEQVASISVADPKNERDPMDGLGLNGHEGA